MSRYIYNIYTADVPHCRPDQVLVYGVARYETVRISCDVVSSTIQYNISNTVQYSTMMTHVIFIYNGTLQMSNPSSGLRFHWVFNTTAATQAQPSPGGGAGGGAVKVEGTRSVVDYTPRTELDYGHLVCWAENSIGPQVGRDIEKIFRCSRKNIFTQRAPCTYHIIPAGPPDPVHNCTVFNQTFTSLQIVCSTGFDGGLKQLFKLEVNREYDEQIMR